MSTDPDIARFYGRVHAAVAAAFEDNGLASSCLYVGRDRLSPGMEAFSKYVSHVGGVAAEATNDYRRTIHSALHPLYIDGPLLSGRLAGLYYIVDGRGVVRARYAASALTVGYNSGYAKRVTTPPYDVYEMLRHHASQLRPLDSDPLVTPEDRANMFGTRYEGFRSPDGKNYKGEPVEQTLIVCYDAQNVVTSCFLRSVLPHKLARPLSTVVLQDAPRTVKARHASIPYDWSKWADVTPFSDENARFMLEHMPTWSSVTRLPSYQGLATNGTAVVRLDWAKRHKLRVIIPPKGKVKSLENTTKTLSGANGENDRNSLYELMESMLVDIGRASDNVCVMAVYADWVRAASRWVAVKLPGSSAGGIQLYDEKDNIVAMIIAESTQQKFRYDCERGEFLDRKVVPSAYASTYKLPTDKPTIPRMTHAVDTIARYMRNYEY